MHFNDLIKLALDQGASDLHLHVGLPAMARISGRLTPISAATMSPRATELLVELMCDAK